MTVNVRTIQGNQKFYTAAEVEAIATTAALSASSMWDVYHPTYINGWQESWDQSAVFVNKHTNMVHYNLGFARQNATAATSLTFINAIPQAELHPDMPIKYIGYPEYATVYVSTTGADNSAATLQKWSNVLFDANINLGAGGTFNLQGEGSSTSYLGSFIEVGIGIGKNATVVTTTNPNYVPTPLYLDDGMYYNADDTALLTGKGWLKYTVSNPAGYKSGDYVALFKNLWSGEVIMQYSLHPATANSWPAVPIPSRFTRTNLFYITPRYMTTGSGNTGINYGQYVLTSHMHVQNGQLVINVNANTNASWITGTTSWLMNTEACVPAAVDTSRSKLAESSEMLHHGTSNKMINATTEATKINYSTYYDTTNTALGWKEAKGYNAAGTQVSGNTRCPAGAGYKGRGSSPSFFEKSRTGMSYLYLDNTTTGTTWPATLTTTTWSDWLKPSSRYRRLDGTDSPKLYMGQCTYLSNSTTQTAAGAINWYTSNIFLPKRGTYSATPVQTSIGWGTTGQAAHTAETLGIWYGYCLTDET